MKKTYLILIIASVVIVSSCQKKLDQIPISTPTTATFYKQQSDFIQAVNAAYNGLRNVPNQLMFLSEVRSDNIYPSNNDVARDHDPINNFAKGIAPNVYVEAAWNNDFVGIFKANTALDQITKNSSYIGNTVLANRLTAEAKFLRAFYYFDLVKYYGKVPLIDHPVVASEAITIGRSPVKDVYALIIADLQFAIANLPLNYGGAFPLYSAADAGRATKYAAEAILAKVYMARSGPTYGIEGPGLGLSEWNLALPLLQDIINSGLFVFNPTQYAFPTPANGIFSYNATQQNPINNKEAVFDITFITGSTNPVLGSDYPWLLAPQTYFNSFNGNPTTSGTIGVPSVSYNLLNSYAAADKRIAPFIHTTTFVFNLTPDAHPFFRKWLDTTQAPVSKSRFDWGINFIAVRYTDILMLKAECILNGAPGSQATDVDAVVNLVRARAGLTPVAGVTLAQLYDERRREFANEGSRWFDLQRSGNLLTIMNAFEAVEDAVLHKMNPVILNYIIYPVPQSQLDGAPGLYIQNLGY
jgi:starch-binding outer membrane protein, SusD/RagB family